MINKHNISQRDNMLPPYYANNKKERNYGERSSCAVATIDERVECSRHSSVKKEDGNSTIPWRVGGIEGRNDNTGSRLPQRTATLKVVGHAIQLKLKAYYDKKAGSHAVILNKQYPNEKYKALPKTLELYDADRDEVECAIFAGVTKGSYLRFDNELYKVVEPTPFEVEEVIVTPPISQEKDQAPLVTTQHLKGCKLLCLY